MNIYLYNNLGAIPRTQTDGIRVPNIDIGVDIVDGGGGQGNEQRNQQNRNSVIGNF
mgnify:CR=1 FL=1